MYSKSNHKTNNFSQQSRFVDKVVIITGSSSGIGQHAAVEYGKEGAKVVIHGRSVKGLQQTKQMMIEAGVLEENIFEIIACIDEEETPKKIIEETMERFGKIDVLVNNAGASRHPDYQSHELENLNFLFKVNFKSVVALTQYALPYLEKTNGNVLQISSTAAVTPLQSESFYCSMKAALDQFMRCFALEYGPKGIRFNCLNPGFIKTNIVGRLGVESSQQLKTLKWIEDNTALQRIGEVSEVSPAILFLTSDDASYVTGSNWLLDGGMHIFMQSNRICETKN